MKASLIYCTLILLTMAKICSANQNVSSLSTDMHNYINQPIEFHGLYGDTYDLNSSHVFKGAKKRWGDFNGDGLEDVMILSGDSHQYFNLRNVYNRDICLDVVAATQNIINYTCHAGINQRWRYDETAGHLVSASDESKCLHVAANKNLFLGSCRSRYRNKFHFFDDGTIRLHDINADSGTLNDFAINGFQLQSGEFVGVYNYRGLSPNKQWRKDFTNMKVRVFLNTGEDNRGKFIFKQVREFTGIYDLPFWGDFDGDGKDELLLSQTPTSDIRTTTTDLSQVKYVRSPTWAVVMGVGDFSNDGIDEILYSPSSASGLSSDHYSVFNNTLNTITDASTLIGEYHTISISGKYSYAKDHAHVLVGNFDSKDGDDIVVQNMLYHTDGKGAHILFNSGRGKNFTGYRVKALVNNTWYSRVGVNTQADLNVLHVGKLDGQDSLLRQEGGPMADDDIRTLEALQFHHTDGNYAQFTYRPIKVKGSANSLNYHNGARLSFGDINGDGQSDVFISEYNQWANDNGNSFGALVHTKWDEDFSLTQAGQLQHSVNVYSDDNAATEHFSSGNFGVVNYFIYYDINGTLYYKLRDAGSDNWGVRQEFPFYNKTSSSSADVALGLKSIVIGNYLYTMRFSATNKVLIDRWNINRNNSTLRLVPTEVGSSTNMVQEDTVTLNLGTSYDKATAKLAVYVLKPGHNSAHRLHFMYPNSRAELVNKTLLLKADGSVPASFDGEQTIDNVVGEQFLGAMVVNHKQVVNLTPNAQVTTNRTTAVMNASVHVAIIMGNSTNLGLAFIPVTVGAQLGKLPGNSEVTFQGYKNLGDVQDRYLGMVPKEHSLLGLNIILNQTDTGLAGIGVIQPTTLLTKSLYAHQLGYRNKTLKGFGSVSRISANQFCNQAMFILSHKPYAFNIDCRAVKFERYGNDISIDTIVGIIEGPPPFPAENLKAGQSNFANYSSVSLTEEGGEELKLVSKAGLGQQHEVSGKMLYAGFGAYADYKAQSKYTQGYENIFATTESSETKHTMTAQNCEQYAANSNESYQAYFYRMKGIDGTGYNPQCFRNTGALVVRGTKIDIYAVVDKEDGQIYGLMPIPTKERTTTHKTFYMDRDYVRVGSLDGRLGAMHLGGKKLFGDNDTSSLRYASGYQSYQGNTAALTGMKEYINRKVRAQRTLLGLQFGYNGALSLASGSIVGPATTTLGMATGGILASLVSLDGIPQTSSYTFSSDSDNLSSTTLSVSDQESFAFNGSGSVMAGFATSHKVEVGFFGFSARSLDIETNAGAGATWEMETELTDTSTASRTLTIAQNSSPFRGIAYDHRSRPTNSSRCLGLVESYTSQAHYIPTSHDNYRHFLTKSLDRVNNTELELPVTASPWLITYTVPYVNRLDPVTDDFCTI